jgi:hypothetical protein
MIPGPLFDLKFLHEFAAVGAELQIVGTRPCRWVWVSLAVLYGGAMWLDNPREYQRIDVGGSRP